MLLGWSYPIIVGVIKIDKNVDYKKGFELKYNWISGISPVMLLIKATAKLKDRIDLGYFIAKQVIIINTLNIFEHRIEFEADIEKHKKIGDMDSILCRFKVNSQNETLIKLKTILIRKILDTEDKKKSKLNYEYKKIFFKRITKEEVCRFSNMSKDPNSIHKGDNPVVQGMLILLFLEDYLSLREKYMYNCEVTYIKPVSANDDIFLYWKNQRTLIGISNEEICFKLNFKDVNK